ncbi:MAG: M23 family metallopeptidase [Stigonema ocellatum SAG 48.90 = DSM 106950]|nr:M23 family metallopeptidase [Stigonema ocellatum SAG 48.90 = DSM 106950]
MAKVTFSQICTYGLIGLVSFTTVVSGNTSAKTQTAYRTLNKQSPNPTSSLIWPTQGIISQGFNKNRHIGIDIAGPPGTPILAAASGQVVKSGWDDWGLGNVIRIHHPDGRFTVYGHNRRLLVKNGQQISQGQAIAEMGTTGNSSGPHLHFEVHPHDMVSVVDPIPVLPHLVAGKIPSQRIATSTISSQAANPTPTGSQQTPSQSIPIPVESTPTAQQTPSQSIPIPVESAMVNTGCSGATVIEGETATSHVKVCQENGQLFYIGQLKQNPDKPIRLPAMNVGRSLYRADNGSFSYFVSPEGVQVWRNGSPIRTDSFSTAN